MQTSLSMCKIGTVIALLHASYQLQDLIRIQGFEGQNHLQ
jgi:hypothetical protein